MAAVPRRHLVENRICEAKRVSREHELHQRRLADIASGRRTQPLIQGTKAELLVAGARGTHPGANRPLPSHHDYPHLSRRQPHVQATTAALQDRLQSRAHAAELERIRSRPGVVAVQQHKAPPREELGRFVLGTASERSRKQKASALAKENAELRQRLRSAPPRFASDSAIRTLQGRPPPHKAFATAGVDASTTAAE